MKIYAKYKDSGVPWLREVPEHWETIKTKHLFQERIQKGFPNEPLLAATQTKGVIPKSMYENRTVEAQKDLHLLKLVEEGDFVISLRSFQGGIEYAHYRGIISPAYTIMVPNQRIRREYYKHLAKSKNFISLLQTCVTGIREGQNINYEILRKAPLPVPPQKEQQQIARYLDWKTAKIDTFIKAKKRIIVLLKEQKQNIINEAVTKGINSNIKMKDSGVEWLGEIPEHWEVKKVKQCAKKISKGTTPSTQGKNILERGKIRFLKAENIVQGKITKYPLYFIDEETNSILKRSQIRKNDILFVIAGATLGKIAVVSEGVVPANINQAIAFIRPNNSVNTEYLALWLSSLTIKSIIGVEAVQSAQPNLAMGRLGNFIIPTPLIIEQQSIINRIKKETTLIDKAISQTEQQIKLVQEYRTRLISDVVTGKVDIRSVKIPDFEPVPADLEIQEDEKVDVEQEQEIVT